MATMDSLHDKILNIADKYADYLEKRIFSLNESGKEVSFEEIDRVNEGIRMLNHFSSTLLKIKAHNENSSQVID